MSIEFSGTFQAYNHRAKTEVCDAVCGTAPLPSLEL